MWFAKISDGKKAPLVSPPATCRVFSKSASWLPWCLPYHPDLVQTWGRRKQFLLFRNPHLNQRIKPSGTRLKPPTLFPGIYEQFPTIPLDKHCLSLSCFNKVPWTGWLPWQMQTFLTVLKKGSGVWVQGADWSVSVMVMICSPSWLANGYLLLCPLLADTLFLREC